MILRNVSGWCYRYSDILFKEKSLFILKVRNNSNIMVTNPMADTLPKSNLYEHVNIDSDKILSLKSKLLYPKFNDYNVNYSWTGMKNGFHYFVDMISYLKQYMGSSYLDYFNICSGHEAVFYMIPVTLSLSILLNVYMSFKNVGKEQELFMNITERNKLSQLLIISQKTYDNINKVDVLTKKSIIDKQLFHQLRKKFFFESYRLIPYSISWFWMGCLPESIAQASTIDSNSFPNITWFDNYNHCDPLFILPLIHCSLLYFVIKNYDKNKKLNLSTHFSSFKYIWAFIPYTVFVFQSFPCACELAFISNIICNIIISKFLKYSMLSTKQNLKCENTFNVSVVEDFFSKIEKQNKDIYMNYEDAFLNPKLFPGKQFNKDYIVKELNKFIRKSSRISS